MNVTELEVQAGEPIPAAFERLKKWVESLQVVTAGTRGRVHYSPRQIDVIFDGDDMAFIPDFEVLIDQSTATIGHGTLNNLTPTIDGKKIDGESADGTTKGAQPVLDLRSGPNAELKSWVCLLAKIDTRTGKLLKDDPVNVVHRNTIPRIINGGIVDENGTGICPLARLGWSSDRSAIIDLRQIVMHSLKHAFVASRTGGLGRHFFYT